MVRTGESGSGWSLLSEERLIARARGGDQPAFAELVRRHGASAWYLALVVTGSPKAATEAAGRGLLRTMATLDPGRWTPAEAYRPWLLRSVHSAAAGGRPGAAPDLIDLTEHLADDADAEIEIDLDAGPGSAALAYASLPGRQRAALWMAEVEALSVDDVARGLDLEALDAARTLERGRVRFATTVGSWRDEQHFEHLPGALAAFALPVPSALEDDALARWRTWVALSRAPEPAVKPARRPLRAAWSQVHDDGLGARVAAAAAIVVFLLGAVGAALIGSTGNETTDTPVEVAAGPQATNPPQAGDDTTTAGDGEKTATTKGKGAKTGKASPTTGGTPNGRGPGTTGTTRPGDDPENRRPGTTAPPPTNLPVPPPPSTPTTRPRGTTTTTRPRTTTTTTQPTTTTTESTTTTTEPETTTTTETTLLPCDLPLICP